MNASTLQRGAPTADVEEGERNQSTAWQRSSFITVRTALVTTLRLSAFLMNSAANTMGWKKMEAG